MTIEDLYFKAWRTGPNIGEHCPTLRLLASECQTVVEFGTDHAVSTTALLAAQPDNLVTIDKAPSPAAELLRPLAGRTHFEIFQADSLETAPIETDLLLIDSLHTCAQLLGELQRHAANVRRWIVLHDTETFGEVGEDGMRGLKAAVHQFLAARPEWRIVAEYRNSHGLTVLRRQP